MLVEVWRRSKRFDTNAWRSCVCLEAHQAIIMVLRKPTCLVNVVIHLGPWKQVCSPVS
jgi:hypothetical protein